MRSKFDMASARRVICLIKRSRSYSERLHLNLLYARNKRRVALSSQLILHPQDTFTTTANPLHFVDRYSASTRE